MKIQVRASYNNENKVGSIRVSKIVGNRPLEYTLQLFENTSINTNRNKFASISSAISHASLYGFLTNLWSIEETDV